MPRDPGWVAHCSNAVRQCHPPQAPSGDDAKPTVAPASSSSAGRHSIAESDTVDASEKWFITVLVRRDCRICDRMVSDFAQHPHLRPLVNALDHQQSWANFNVCHMDDPTQAARFKHPNSDLTIKGYPTLLVQPPTSGKYGSAQTIVLQKTGYDGNASKFADQLMKSIVRYASAIEQKTTSEAIANRKPASTRVR
jgi:hypothetical protein